MARNSTNNEFVKAVFLTEYGTATWFSQDIGPNSEFKLWDYVNLNY